MFAIFETGGKQYRVRPGDVVRVEKLDATDTVNFDHVLMAYDGAQTHIGAPKVSDAHVHAEILETRKQDKVLIFKKKRRNNYRRLNGHRQILTTVRVRDIVVGAKRSQDAALKVAPKASDATVKAAPKKQTKATTPTPS